MKKIWKKIVSVVVSLAMAGIVSIVPSIPALANSGPVKPAALGQTYYVGDFIDFHGECIVVDYLLESSSYYLGFDGSFQITSITQTEYGDYMVMLDGKNGFYSPYGPDSFHFDFGDGTFTSPFSFYAKSESEEENTDWLNPLRTQLNIAADPEFGGNVNHTAEYTGDFALPKEVMVFIKEHKGVTLNYSFYVEDVLQTVTITSENVVVEEDVDWYGFSYLLSHYGNGAKGASGGYTIVAGDTLTTIAKKLGTTVEALAAKNGIKNVDLIYAGSKIAY